jgi:hypothetical protein
MARCKEPEFYWRKLQKKKDKGAAAINSFVLYGKKDCIFVIQILLVVR